MPEPGVLKRPVYLSLVRSIENAIRSGALSPGERLPTHRDFADHLGVSVQTVSRAYEELIRRKVIVGEVGRGSYVRALALDTRTPFVGVGGESSLIDLSILKPVIAERHYIELRNALVEVSGTLDPILVQSFRPNTVHETHRGPGADWLRECGLDVAADSILITNGTTPALTIALMTAARAGAKLLVPEITHHTIPPLARYLGIDVTALEMDEYGVSPDAIDAACREHEVCALYLGPNAVNPLGRVMPMARRREIVAMARKSNIFIIENEVFGPLPSDRLTPLAALAPERVFYATSFSKCVMPGLRTGYLVAPEAIRPSALNRHLICNWMATPLTAEIASNWVRSGIALELVNWQRKELGKRYRLAADILPEGCFMGHPEGLHVWITLPDGWGETEFAAQARLRGVALAPSAPFRSGGGSPAGAVRLSTGSTSYNQLRRGLEIVAGLLVSAPEPALLIL